MAAVLNQDLFLDFVIGLFALLNPLLAVPLFLGLTGGMGPAERQRTAAVAALTTLIALIVAAFVGDQILDVFGIHIPAFQVAGGLIVFTIALGMLRDDQTAGTHAASAVTGEAAAARSIAVYPLAIPLLAGPGAFVTVIVFSARIENLGDSATLSAGIAAIVAVLWLSMAFATTLARFLNPTAISIGTEILGVLLAAVSVEMIFAGLDGQFRSWFQ